jgi:hypothetical protein
VLSCQNGQERERGVGASRPSVDGGSDWPDALAQEGPLNFSIVEAFAAPHLAWNSSVVVLDPCSCRNYRLRRSPVAARPFHHVLALQILRYETPYGPC